MESVYLGIEIGGTKLQLVIGDAEGNILRRKRLLVETEKGGEGIRQRIAENLPALVGDSRLVGVGVGFGGPVDWRTGRTCCSHQVKGWSDFPFGTWLSELAQAPTRIDNDGNTAGLGEALSGAGRGFNPVFYVTLGSGVGGGLVVDGRIYHGATPGEAEIGHVRLDRSGAIVESRCSGWAVDARIREAIQEAPGSALARLVAGRTAPGEAPRQGGEARFLVQALAERDPVAQKILSETAVDLGFALSHVTHLFHPETIVLGGGLSLIGEPLRDAVGEALSLFVMDAFRPGPKVQLAGLGEDAVPVGALLLARGKS